MAVFSVQREAATLAPAGQLPAEGWEFQGSEGGGSREHSAVPRDAVACMQRFHGHNQYLEKKKKAVLPVKLN